MIQSVCKALHKLQQQTLAPRLQAQTPGRNMLEVSIHTVIDLQAQHQAAHLGPLYTKVPFKTKCEAASCRKNACRSPLGREVPIAHFGASDRSKLLNPSMTEETNVLGFQA